MMKTSVPSRAVSSTDSYKIQQVHECVLEKKFFTIFFSHCNTESFYQLYTSLHYTRAQTAEASSTEVQEARGAPSRPQ